MGEMVTYHSDGGTSEGYLALPADAGPAVIVIQEWWGLVPHIVSLADRFAAEGFVALAPDLYHGARAAEPDEAGKLAMGLAMDRAARDIAGAADHLAKLSEVTGPIGAVGFCMGGSLALWSATLSDRIVATVGFYPALPGPRSELASPAGPADAALPGPRSELASPAGPADASLPWERMSPEWSNYAGKAALIHCSEADGTSAAPGIQAAKSAIEAAGGQVTLHDYPGTQHGFFNDDRPEVYAVDASQTAWARTLEHLRSHLG